MTFLILPYVVSAYHLEAGGRAISSPELSTDDALRAQEHLHEAIDWDPDNAQAYRLLARVYGEQGDWPAAIQALTIYTKLRPGSPLGHMELALAYEASKDKMPEEEAQSLDAQIAAEWRRTGMKAEDFIQAGEQAREAKQYGEALAWYERAMRSEPDLADPWYHLGLLREDQKQWAEALDAYERAIVLGRFRRVHRSSSHYQAGMVYYLHLDPPQLDDALVAFDTALAVDDFDSAVEAAACHYRRGQVLREQKASPDEYIAEFREAIALNPALTAAHLWLGITLYQRDRDVDAAEAEILKALELAPQYTWAYLWLGDIYRQEGRVEEAAAMYEQALAIDPAFEQAQKRLEALGAGE